MNYLVYGAQGIIILGIAWPDFVEFSLLDVCSRIVYGLKCTWGIEENAIRFEADCIAYKED